MSSIYREKCEIMYTDDEWRTVPFTICDDVYEIMKRDISRFDTSDYAVDNVYSIPCRKKVPGLMKNKNNGAIMIEFVGFKAKYTLRINSKKYTKKV